MFDRLQIKIAKPLMRRFSPPTPRVPTVAGPGIFRHESYTQGTTAEQRKILLESSRYRYDYESRICFFEEFFPWIPREEFRGKSVLDLGCFTGGRIVYWKEYYDLGDAYGIDIKPVFAEAGTLFAEEKEQDVTFATGFGEQLPYDDNTFDFIASFDVFEHVRSVEQTMSECYRTLKPGGRLLTSFPPFYQPLESHLGSVTKLIGLQCVFSSIVLRRAECELQTEHGPSAYWYGRSVDDLGDWEKLPTLNGITVRKFRRIVRQQNWKLRGRNRRPILSTGRRAKRIVFRILRHAFAIPARLPWLEEAFLDRICVDLEKVDDGAKLTPSTPGKGWYFG